MVIHQMYSQSIPEKDQPQFRIVLFQKGNKIPGPYDFWVICSSSLWGWSVFLANRHTGIKSKSRQMETGIRKSRVEMVSAARRSQRESFSGRFLQFKPDY
jgi:hypothetical protein